MDIQEQHSNQRGVTLGEMTLILTIVAGVIIAVISWNYFDGKLTPDLIPGWISEKFTFVNLIAMLATMGIATHLVTRTNVDYFAFVNVALVAITAIALASLSLYLYLSLAEVRNILFAVLLPLLSIIIGGGLAYWLSDYIAATFVMIWAVVLYLVAIVLGLKTIHFLFSLTF